MILFLEQNDNLQNVIVKKITVLHEEHMKSILSPESFNKPSSLKRGSGANSSKQKKAVCFAMDLENQLPESSSHTQANERPRRPLVADKEDMIAREPHNHLKIPLSTDTSFSNPHRLYSYTYSNPPKLQYENSSKRRPSIPNSFLNYPGSLSFQNDIFQSSAPLITSETTSSLESQYPPSMQTSNSATVPKDFKSRNYDFAVPSLEEFFLNPRSDSSYSLVYQFDVEPEETSRELSAKCPPTEGREVKSSSYITQSLTSNIGQLKIKEKSQPSYSSLSLPKNIKITESNERVENKDEKSPLTLTNQPVFFNSAETLKLGASLPTSRKDDKKEKTPIISDDRSSVADSSLSNKKISILDQNTGPLVSDATKLESSNPKKNSRPNKPPRSSRASLLCGLKSEDSEENQESAYKKIDIQGSSFDSGSQKLKRKNKKP